MGATVPVPCLVATDEPQIGLMHQRRGLQSLSRLLVIQPVSGQPTQLVIDKRQKLLGTIEEELTVHTKIEEDVFYPALFDAARTSEDKEMYYEAMEEHHVVDLVLPKVKSTDATTPEFAAKAKVLKDLVEHHAEEEESKMFPRVRKLIDRDRLVELGEALTRAKESAKASFMEKLSGMVRS